MNIPFIAPKKILGLNKDSEIKYALFSASTTGGRNVKQSNIGKYASQLLNSGYAFQEDVEGNAIQNLIHGDSTQIRVKRQSTQIYIEGNASQKFVGEAYMNYVRGNAEQSYVGGCFPKVKSSGCSFMDNIDGDASIQHVKGTAYAGRIGGTLTIGDIETFKTDNKSRFSKLIIDGDIRNFDGDVLECKKYEIKNVTKPIPLGHHAGTHGSLPTRERKSIIPEKLKEILEDSLS